MEAWNVNYELTANGGEVLMSDNILPTAMSLKDAQYVEATQPESILSLISQDRRMEEALRPALNVMEMLVDPEAIKSTTIIQAYAQCQEVASKLRKALQDQDQ